MASEQAVQSKEEKKGSSQKDGKKEEPKKEAPAKHLASVVRLAGRDLDGSLNIYEALIKIKGVGHTLASGLVKIICRELGISEETELTQLTEEQVARIEGIMKAPSSYGIKPFQLNRQKDMEATFNRFGVNYKLKKIVYG